MRKKLGIAISISPEDFLSSDQVAKDLRIMESVINANRQKNITVSVETVARTSVSSYRYNSSLYAPDGNIYMFPYHGDYVDMFDPRTNEVTEKKFRLPSTKDLGPALDPETGIVYFARESGKTLTAAHLETGEVYPDVCTFQEYCGRTACFKDGVVYIAAKGAGINTYDVKSGEVGFINYSDSESIGNTHGCAVFGDRIYFFGYDSYNRIGWVNTKTGDAQVIRVDGVTHKRPWYGGCSSPEGVFLCPYELLDPISIDPQGTAHVESTNKYTKKGLTARVGVDGKIYHASYGGSTLESYDPETKNITQYDITDSSGSIVNTPDGNMYTVPSSGGDITKITFNGAGADVFPEDVCLGSVLNNSM